jgi:hypothetical protein
VDPPDLVEDSSSSNWFISRSRLSGRGRSVLEFVGLARVGLCGDSCTR